MEMSLLQWVSLAGVCLAGAASPGPSLAVVMRASIAAGPGTGLLTAWAHAMAVALYALLTVLGVSAVLAAAPLLFTAVQVAGACYLIYLAAGMLTSSGGPQDEDETVISERRAAVDGFSIAFLNPKLALFMLALFSQFVRPEFALADLALMVATAGVIDGAWYSVVTLLVTRPVWLERLRRHGRIIDRMLGLMILILALTILADAMTRL